MRAEQKIYVKCFAVNLVNGKLSIHVNYSNKDSSQESQRRDSQQSYLHLTYRP